MPLQALVVGAGPSGLVAAKYLQSEYHVTIVESSSQVGGSFVNKVYDNTRLVSSKYITAFSDFRMSEDQPNHPSAAEYVSYLNSYCDRFGLRQRIQFECTVISIKDAIHGYSVQYHRTRDDTIITKQYDVVAICSGLHTHPYRPQINTKSFKGQRIHSSQYKDPSIFNHKRVLILGSGETAMDIAHRAISNPQSQSVALSVRRGFLSIPHNLAEDRPLDVFITNLFEHAYEHPWVHQLRLRWHLSTVFIRLFLLLTGSSWGFNQWAVPTDPIRRGYHIINKSHAAMSHLNVPIKRQSLWGRFWMWVYQETNLRPIQSFPKTQVVGVQEDGVTVVFEDGRTYEADLIVLATGYKQSFPFLDERIRKEMKEEGMRNNKHLDLEEDYLPTEHFICSSRRPNLGFIGFVRPNVGAIPPMSELQTMWWLQRMKGRVHMIRRNQRPSYMVLGDKYQYGVDYGNYMHRVAEDIGAAPTLTTLATKSDQPFKALYTYAVGQCMVPFFRLQGPYASKICWEVVTGELWRVCLKRGIAENVGLLYMLWLSLLMNLAACALECVWCLVTVQKPKFVVRY